MNTPDHCSDDTINRLIDTGALRRTVPKPLINAEPLVARGELPDPQQLTPLLMHPDENIVEVVQALALNGFGVYSVPSKGTGEPMLCIAKRWRINAIHQQRARAAMSQEQREAEDANAAAVQRSLASGFE